MFSMEGLLFEGVEIDADEIDGRQAQLGAGVHVGGVGAALQDAAMDFGMERLDAAVEDFRMAGERGDVDDGDVGIAQGGGGAAGGQDFDAERGEAAGEINQAGLVGYAEKGALNLHMGANCSTGGKKWEGCFRPAPDPRRA